MTAEPESHEIAVRYRELLAAWNSRQANVFASLFSETALVIGYDGSQMTGRAEVESSLQGIFSHHETAAYVSKVRSVRQLGPDVAILHAVVGMIPPGQSDLTPDRNAVQTLVGHRTSAGWEIENFQNTPAEFHGRPELSDRLTEELRTVLRQR